MTCVIFIKNGAYEKTNFIKSQLQISKYMFSSFPTIYEWHIINKTYTKMSYFLLLLHGSEKTTTKAMKYYLKFCLVCNVMPCNLASQYSCVCINISTQM